MLKKQIIGLLIFFSFIQLIFGENHHFKYHSYSENQKQLKQLSKKYKSIMSSDILTKTNSGKNISIIEIKGGEKSTNPAILIVGGVEGNEITSTEICIDLIRYIGSNYSKDQKIQNILKKSDIYIIPQINPDASESFFNSVKFENKVNNSKVDNDMDGLTNEDEFNDLNGDGYITTLRVQDIEGEWIVNKDYPVMQKYSTKDSISNKYSIYTEGIDDDNDGLFNEDCFGGVNINKNFPYDYDFSDKEAGIYGLSQNESKAIVDYVLDNQNIILVYSFTNNNNLLEFWPHSKTDYKTYYSKFYKTGKITKTFLEDHEVLKEISNIYKKSFQNVDYFDTEKLRGNFPEWVYYHTGRVSMTTPSWRFSLDCDSTKDDNKDVEYYKWLQRTNQENKFLKWTKIKHKDFPDQEVEIGGFLPYYRLNAPQDSLKQIFEKYRPFILELCGMMPDIKIESVKSKKLHSNVYRIEMYMINNGKLATSTEIGKLIKWIPKIRVNMDENVEILSGKKFFVIDQIKENGNIEKLTWLIKTDKNSITLKVHSPIFGDFAQEVTL